MVEDTSNQDPRDYRGGEVIAGTVVVFALASLAVLLRFWARRLKNVELWFDDWLIAVAWPFCLGLFVLNMLSVHWGQGRHLRTLPVDHLIKIANCGYALEIVWAVTLPIIKLSILALYNRVFGNMVLMRRVIWGLGAFSIMLAVAIALVCAFQCTPVRVAWKPIDSGTCIDTRKFFLTGSAIDLATWVVLLLLPMPAVWKLQKKLVDRISLMVIFTLGGLTCVISAVRMAQLAANTVSNPDTTWTSVQVSIWTVAQPCLGVVCACLPTMTPLLRACIPGTKKGYTRSRGTYFRNHLSSQRQKSASGRDSPNFAALGLDDDIGFRFKVDKGDRLSQELHAIDHLQGADRNPDEIYSYTTIEVETDRKRTGL